MMTINEFKNMVVRQLVEAEEREAYIKKYNDELDQIEMWETGVDPTCIQVDVIPFESLDKGKIEIPVIQVSFQ